MFGKLVKHEWIAAKKLTGTICIAVFCAGILSGGVLRYMAWSAAMGNSFMITLYTIVLTLSMVVILGSCFATKYLMIYRFYKSRLEEEGYLTLTLPVTAHQQLLASMVNTTLCVLLVGLVACISTGLSVSIFFSAFESAGQQELTGILADAAKNVLETFDLSGSLLILEAADLIAAYFFDMILLMLCCTVAMFFPWKHPIVVGAGIYIGTDFLVSGLADGIHQVLMTEGVRSFEGVLFSLLLHTVAAVAGYRYLHKIMSKNVNLT